MANDLELQQEAELKLKAKAIVENFIKSYGENQRIIMRCFTIKSKA